MLATFADRFFASACLVTGLSHVVQPAAWAEFFRRLLESKIAAFVIALYTLPTGLLIVLSHDDWRWGAQWAFLFFGVAHTFKGTLYLLSPSVANRTIRKHGLEAKPYRIGGA